MVERTLCCGIVKGVIGAELSRRGQSRDEASFLAVDQRMSTAVPRSSLALNKAEQADEPCNLTHVMDDVLKPPLLDDLPFIDGADRVVCHQTRLVRPTNPGLLVVHDVRDFVIVRSRAVLFDVVAPRCQRLHFVVGKD